MHRTLYSFAALTCIGLLSSCGENTPTESKPPLLTEGIRATASGVQITADCETALSEAKTAFDALEAQTGEATVESVFGQYETMADALTGIGDVGTYAQFTPTLMFEKRPTPVVSDNQTSSRKLAYRAPTLIESPR